MEARCVFYIKVGILDQLEESKFCGLTVSILEIVMLTIQVASISGESFMYNPVDVLRQTSPDVHSVEEYPIHM